MIIGRGDIASVLDDREGALIFAAGVSNSSELCELNYRREIRALESAIIHASMNNMSLTYFSTISIFFKTSRYTKHKIEMEDFIRMACDNYNIIRIGNINWGKNPNTFLNYITNKIAKREPVEIRDEYKFMISKDQLRTVVNSMPLIGKNEISAFGECKKVIDLIPYDLKKELI